MRKIITLLALTFCLNVKAQCPITITGNNIVCSGETATLLASGATTYTWTSIYYTPYPPTGASFAISPISTTVYTVTGTSGTCTAITTVTIVVNPLPAPPVLSGTTTLQECLNAAPRILSVTPDTGSVAVWTNSYGFLTTGNTYTASAAVAGFFRYFIYDSSTVTGCTSSPFSIPSFNVWVDSPPAITISTSSYSLCSGSSISSATLTAGGANTYTWSPSTTLSNDTGVSVTASPSNTTVYSVVGANAIGCLSSPTTITLTVNPTPIVSAVASPTAICAGGYFPTGGGTSTLTASGALTYTWSTGANTKNIVVGNFYNNSMQIVTYTVVGTNSVGCTSATTAVTLTVNPDPMAPTCPSMPGANFTICADSVLTFSVIPDSGTVCIWSSGCAAGSCSGSGVGFSPSTNIFNVNSSPSDWELFINVYDSSTVTGCTSLNNSGAILIVGVVATSCTGVEQYANNNEQISIYPNPNNGSFIVEPSSTIKQTLQIFDVNGKVVLTQTINGKTIIDGSNLNDGVYNLNIISADGVTNKKLIIVK